MRRLSLILCLLMASSTSSWADGLDSLLKRLPSQSSYFTPTPLQDSTLTSQDHRARSVVDYLKVTSIQNPTGIRSRLVSLLSLPQVLRSYPQIAPLGITAPKLSLGTGMPSRTESLPALLSLYQTEAALTNTVLSTMQSGYTPSIFYTASALQYGQGERRLSTLSPDRPREVTSELRQQSIKDYEDWFSVAEIERKYWIPRFESSIQFSQNYISDNWHKGGSSNLNLQMRNYFSLLYDRDHVRWLNELEHKLGLYQANEGSKRYRINEDLLRLHSNYGIKINKRWSYTIDGEVRTQLFNIYNSDRTVRQSAPFSPIKTNLGVGLQYTYAKKSTVRYGRQFALSVNLAPLSHNWRWAPQHDIDLPRHGLSAGKYSKHTFGSTLRADMQWDMTMDVSWSSRLYFNTSYQSVEAEWENTLVMRISRYFSTRINVQLRFDDSVMPSPRWHKRLQLNELLSFGFNYRF